MKRLLQRTSRTPKGTPLGWLLGFTAIIVAILFELLELVVGIQILLMYTLVLVTWQYARSAHEQAEASKKMAEEMHQSRFASFQPIVVLGRSPASVEPPDKNIVVEQTTIERRTYLYNVGPGPALNLNFFLKQPNRKSPVGTTEGKKLRALGPGEVYELDLQNAFGGIMWSSHDLTVEYEDIFGRKWCSGLELNYTSGADRFTVIRLFYEKMS